MSRLAQFLTLLATALALLIAVLLYNMSTLIANNKPFIEETLTEKLGSRVEIGHLGVSWGLSGAMFALDDIKINTKKTLLPTIALRRVDMGIDMIHSLFTLTPQISSLTLHGIALELAASPTTFVATIRHWMEGASDGPHEIGNIYAFVGALRHFSISDSTLSLQNDDGSRLPLLDISFEAHRIFSTFDILAKICPRANAVGSCYLVAKGGVTLDRAGSGQGTITLTGEDLLLPLTPIFPEPWHAQHLFARLQLKREQGLFDFKVTELKYSDADLDLRGDIALQFDTTHDRSWLDLNLELPRADASKATRYIPAQVLSPDLMQWLKSSITAGSVEGAIIRIKGNLKDIPEHDGGANLFAITLPLKRGSLQFEPSWPELTGLSGLINITPNSLAITVSEGRSRGVIIDNAKVTLANFEDPAKKLLLELNLTTGSPAAQAYFDHSPLADSLGVVAKKFDMPETRLGLQLLLPLGLDLASNVSGSVQVNDAKLTFRSSDISLSAIRGKVNFTHDAIDAREMRAVFLSMPVVVDVADESFTQKKPVFFKIKGDYSIRALSEGGAPWLSHLADGSSPFTANLVLTHDKGGMTTNFDMRSTMQGIAIHIPQIYVKEQAATAPLRIIATIDANQQANVHATLADALVLNCSSGADFDFFSKPSGNFYRRPSILSNATLTEGFFIDTPRIKGNLSRAKDPGGMLLFDFSRFEIDGSPPAEKEHANAKPERTQFAAFREAQVKIANFRYQDIRVQNLDAKVTGSTQGITLKPLIFTLDGARFGLDKMIFEQQEAGMFTAIEGKLDTQNLGGLLQSQDLFVGLRGLAGKVGFALHWPAEPWLYNKQILTGSIDVDLTDGKLKNSNSILNRIVDLLTLNLQQTLKSDLEIKSIKGRLALAKALVSTEDFSIELAGANTEARGNINLIDETIDSKVAMTIDISRLVKIGIAFVINPVVGGLYWWKGDPDSIPLIDNLTRHSYEVKGPWQNPHITMLPLISLPLFHAP